MIRESKKKNIQTTEEVCLEDPRKIVNFFSEKKNKIEKKDNIKDIWQRAMIARKKENEATVVLSLSSTDVGIFKKAIAKVDWGKLSWSTFLYEVVVYWEDYEFWFRWRTYNHMPSLPNLKFLAFNLPKFVEHYYEHQKSIEKALNSVVAARKEKSNATVAGREESPRVNEEMKLVVESLKQQKELLQEALKDSILENRKTKEKLQQLQNEFNKLKADYFMVLTFAERNGYDRLKEAEHQANLPLEMPSWDNFN